MPLDAVSIESLSEEHLQALVPNQERESKSIEFKVILPGNSYDDRKEFLADFTSFANTVGGDLIYGIRAPNGMAEEVAGLSDDLDAETNRLENLIRTGVQPRITAYTVKAVPLINGRKVLVFRISRSWALPHRVTLSSHDKFYGRNSTGKYSLDVPELRSLFSLSESTADRVRNFRAERVSLILSQQTPVPLIAGPRTVVHVIPFSAFMATQAFDVSRKYDPNFLPILPIARSNGYNFRHNFDGIVTYTASPKNEPSLSYLQLFRNGIIESVDAQMLGTDNGALMMHGQSWEEQLLGAVTQYFNVQSSLGVVPPVLVMVSLLSVRGAKMYERHFPGADVVNRDHLLAPEALADSFISDPGQLFKPAFDSIWNAFGYSRSPSYEDI